MEVAGTGTDGWRWTSRAWGGYGRWPPEQPCPARWWRREPGSGPVGSRSWAVRFPFVVRRATRLTVRTPCGHVLRNRVCLDARTKLAPCPRVSGPPQRGSAFALEALGLGLKLCEPLARLLLRLEASCD